MDVNIGKTSGLFILVERNCDTYALTIKEHMEARMLNLWRPVPPELQNLPMNAVGFSDASETAIAWAFHSPKGMVAEIQPLGEKETIFQLELKAMINGQKALSSELMNTALTWFGDNTAALFVSERGLSCIWSLNPLLLELFKMKRSKKLKTKFAYIPTDLNPVDALSLH